MEAIRIRPVQCNICYKTEHIKMSGGNNMASYTCTMCRNGRPKNMKNVEKYFVQSGWKCTPHTIAPFHRKS